MLSGPIQLQLQLIETDVTTYHTYVIQTLEREILVNLVNCKIHALSKILLDKLMKFACVKLCMNDVTETFLLEEL